MDKQMRSRISWRGLIAGAMLSLAAGIELSVSDTFAADGQIYIVPKTGAFADVRDDLKDAIVSRGYVVDFVGHFNDMLVRTSEAAQSVTPGGAKSPYLNAEYMQFCSAKLTHELISASPRNIVNCPYVVFAYELKGQPGTIHVGYRPPVGEPSRLTQQVNAKISALLRSIVDAVK